MGHEPALIHGIAMKTASELIVHSAARHFFQGRLRHSKQMFFLGLLISLEYKLNCGSVRKLWRLAKTTVANVKNLCHRLNLRIQDAEVELGPCAIERFRPRHRVRHRVRGTLRAPSLVSVC